MKLPPLPMPDGTLYGPDRTIKGHAYLASSVRAWAEAAIEAELAANTLPCGHHHSLMLKSAETGDPLYCELCDLRAQRNDLEIELAAIQRVAEQYQDEAGKLTHELAQARAECERLRADAERYRWLRDNALGMDSVADPDNMVQVWHGTDPALQSYGKTLDAAIDAALARWEA